MSETDWVKDLNADIRASKVCAKCEKDIELDVKYTIRLGVEHSYFGSWTGKYYFCSSECRLDFAKSGGFENGVS